MKNFKKLSTLLIVFAMLLVIVVPTFADGTKTLEIDGKGDNVYEAYQIFAGTLGTDGNLGNITWGNGLIDPETNFGKAVDVAAELKNASDILAKVKEFEPKLNTQNAVVLNAGNSFKKDVPIGYYLIKQTKVASGEVGTKVIVQIVNDTVIKPKTGHDVSFEKKIMDVNDTNEAPLTEGNTLNASDPNWKDSADYDIGDTVPFKLSAEVASDASKYMGPYKLEFVDQLSPELTPVLEGGVLKVVVKVKNAVIAPSNYTVTETTVNGAQAFKITFADINKIDAIGDGDIVNVFLSAILNKNAKIGATTDNLNKAKLVYSNNPSSTQEGENVPTDETEWDTVRVFTYEFDANKIDGASKEALKGAGFTLFKMINGVETKIGEELKGADKTLFEFKGLDDGDYILKETTTPAGYNTIEPIKFTIVATHEELSDNPSLSLVKFTKTGESEILNTNGETTFKMDVENNKGVVLPETGGMGTTILYVLGALLVLVSGIVLVTRKIMVSHK